MARYFYKAINTSGKVVEGHMEANNESDLEVRVSNMELDLIRCKEERQQFSISWVRVDTKELINFTYHLEQLLKAGVPLIDALQDLRDSIDQSAFRDVVSTLIETIGTGKTFSQALAEHPKIFSKVYVSMVHVGETSGQLVQVLQDLAGMLRWQFELTAKAKQMMIYPAFVLAVVILVVVFLMTYLVPQLIPFLKLAGEEIPSHTQALIITSNFFIHYWALVIIAPVAIFALMQLAAKYSPAIRLWIDRFKFKVPVIGPILYKIKLARFCNYFALMYSSGIAVLEAVNMGKRVMSNCALENALERVHESISDGEAISVSFANVGLFPALIVRMLRVGENTGAMSEALLNVSYFYDREVKDAIERLEPAIMPSITIFLGIIVGWIMLSVLGPVYDAVVSLTAL